MSDHDRYYRILGLEPDAAPDAVKRAYRDLARVWHPDRFPSDVRLQEKAKENLRRINEAYANLKDYVPPAKPDVGLPRPSLDDVVGMGELAPSTRSDESVVFESLEISDDEYERATAAFTPPAEATAEDPADSALAVRSGPGHKIQGMRVVGLDLAGASDVPKGRLIRRPAVWAVAVILLAAVAFLGFALLR